MFKREKIYSKTPRQMKVDRLYILFYWKACKRVHKIGGMTNTYFYWSRVNRVLLSDKKKNEARIDRPESLNSPKGLR